MIKIFLESQKKDFLKLETKERERGGTGRFSQLNKSYRKMNQSL